MRLILVRHGEPEGAARGRVYGELDVALSDEGRAQAERVRERLADEKFAAVYSSPRRRALETARILSGIEPRVEPALREIDFGRFEGLTYEEAAARDPEIYRVWMERPTEVTFPGGESWARVRARVAGLSARLRADHAEKTVLVVAHGGPIRALLAEALGLPDANIFRIDQAFAAVNVIEWIGDFPLVKRVNG